MDRDLLHVLIGLVILAIALLLLRDRMRAAGVATGLAVLAGVGMEALDLRDTLAAGLMFDWQDAMSDILRTASIPLMAVGVLVLRRSLTDDPPPK